MFKHPKVVSITAAKLDPEQQSKEQPIPSHRTATVPHIAIRHMLAAAHHPKSISAEETAISPTERTHTSEDPVHAKRSCDDSCNTLAPQFLLQQQKYAKKHTADSLCRGPVLRFRTEGSQLLKCACDYMPTMKTNVLSQGL